MSIQNRNLKKEWRLFEPLSNLDSNSCLFYTPEIPRKSIIDYLLNKFEKIEWTMIELIKMK